MTPDDGEIIRHRAANVIGRPISGLNVLPVELPKPGPVPATVVGMAIEIEVSCFGCRTENCLKVLPIEPRIQVEVLFVEFQYFLTVFLGTSDKRLDHSPYLSGCERDNRTSTVVTTHQPWRRAEAWNAGFVHARDRTVTNSVIWERRSLSLAHRPLTPLVRRRSLDLGNAPPLLRSMQLIAYGPLAASTCGSTILRRTLGCRKPQLE